MISVCIATYNGEKYIREQVESILPQLHDGDEIVISDDHSTDNTLQVIASMASPLIHVYQNNGEKGYTPNFENALRHAKGDYIFLSDQDDVWASNKVKVCMEQMKKYSLVVSDADVTDADGNLTHDSYFKLRRSKGGLLQALIRFSFLGCCLCFRREVLDKALPFPSDHKKCTHDNWLCLVGMLFYKSVVIEDKLIHYRRHGNNTSMGGTVKTTTLWFKLQYRMYLIWNLLLRGFSQNSSTRSLKATEKE